MEFNGKLTNYCATLLPTVGCLQMPTMSVHSWTLCMMTVRPWGIQASSTVTPRIDSQQTYRPHAAVYSSWILEFPVQKDISQRPVNTETHVTMHT